MLNTIINFRLSPIIYYYMKNVLLKKQIKKHGVAYLCKKKQTFYKELKPIKENFQLNTLN